MPPQPVNRGLLLKFLGLPAASCPPGCVAHSFLGTTGQTFTMAAIPSDRHPDRHPARQ